MTQPLIDLLKKGHHSIVIDNGTITTYDTKGIATLLHIVNHDTAQLKGATVVDKVVGKAAAALMILGGVTRLHALLISDGALGLLSTTNIKVSYDQQVPHIINHSGTGWCPMEQACQPCITPEDCLTEIMNKISQLK